MSLVGVRDIIGTTRENSSIYDKSVSKAILSISLENYKGVPNYYMLCAK